VTKLKNHLASCKQKPCKPCNNITNFLAEVIVVVLESEEALISDAVHKCFETDIKIDVVPIPDNSAMGTADSLRHIKDKIKVKVMLLVVASIYHYTVKTSL
jgi:NDP-sugar pyrophosphorylase family protein